MSEYHRRDIQGLEGLNVATLADVLIRARTSTAYNVVVVTLGGKRHPVRAVVVNPENGDVELYVTIALAGQPIYSTRPRFTEPFTEDQIAMLEAWDSAHGGV